MWYKTIKNHFLVKNNIFCQSFQNQVVAVMTVCVPLEACAYPEVRVKQAPPDVTVKTLVPMSTTRYDFFLNSHLHIYFFCYFCQSQCQNMFSCLHCWDAASKLVYHHCSILILRAGHKKLFSPLIEFVILLL